MHFSGEILVTLKFMVILASTLKRVGFHTCVYQGALVFSWMRKSSIRCLPWSFGRVGLEQNSAQVRITNGKGTLSRPNTNVLFLPFTKGGGKKWLSELLTFLSFGINFVFHLHTSVQPPRFPNIRKAKVGFVSSYLKHTQARCLNLNETAFYTHRRKVSVSGDDVSDLIPEANIIT